MSLSPDACDPDPPEADRCVGLRCCPASLVCRVCAVRQLEARGHCWVCGVGATSGDVTSLPEARRIIAVVSRGGDTGAEAVAWLRELRRPLDKWRLVRKELEESDEEKEKMVLSTMSSKRCRTDYYRMNLAKKHFDNSTPYDPKVNLSFHGFKRFGGERKKEFDRHTILPLGSKSFHLRQGSMEPRKSYVKKYLSSASQAKENSQRMSHSSKMVSVEKVTEAVKKPFIDQIKYRYKDNFNIKDLDDMNLQFDKYVEGFIEARELVALYSGREEQVGVREDLAELIIEGEKHFGQYDKLYGTTESIYNIKPK